MNIQRINSYDDPRFSPAALRQHGCYLVDGQTTEVLVLSADTARITGAACPELIEAFRFHAPHITRFVDEAGGILAAYPPRALLTLPIADIQPSQFFVDEDKLTAVADFIPAPEDVIIQALPHEGRCIALDGHTRLYLALQRGWTHIRAVVEEADDSIHAFVDETQRRGIRTPADMTLLPHAAYEIQWNQFCDDFFAQMEVSP